MATKCYEKITEAIANDESKLKECILAKVRDTCCVNDNWLNVSIRYGTPGAWTLTPEYVSASVLDKEWEYFHLGNSCPDPYPRVVLFKPPTGAKTFASVRARDECNTWLWSLHETKQVPTGDIYAALVPAGFSVEFLQADVKYFGPREIQVHEGKPIAGPSKANERSGESGENTPRQPGIVGRESREDTPRQSGVVGRESRKDTPRQAGVVGQESGEDTPKQPGAPDRNPELEQLMEESYPFVPTDIESDDGDDGDMEL